MGNKSFKERLALAKAIPFEKGLNLNDEGGPAAPINIEDVKDPEIEWDHGQPSLLQTPTETWEQDTKNTRKHLDLTKDRGGCNTGTLPLDPNAPIDKLKFVNKDKNITEVSSMTYLSRLACVLAKVSLTFQDMLKLVKSLFPEIKMLYPKPPTYIWNPKPKGGDEAKPKEGEEEEDTSKEKLEPQKIKDKLKIKLPQLTWTLRMADGVDTAEMKFDDGSIAAFEIGANANHLTIKYTEPTREIKKEEPQDDNEEVQDEDWRAT